MAYQSTNAMFGAQQPLMSYLSGDINKRLGQPEARTAAIDQVFNKYGNWDQWSKDLVDTAYNPAILKAQMSKTSPIPTVKGQVGAQAFNNQGIQKSYEAQRKFATGTAMYGQEEARKKALYGSLASTPQVMKALNELDVKYSDPTQSAAWKQAKSLLGLDVLETNVYQPWDKPSFGENLTGMGVSMMPLGVYGYKKGWFSPSPYVSGTNPQDWSGSADDMWLNNTP